MLNNKKGFSLIVLVIAIMVIVIITSTAVISIKNATRDRGVSRFMNDLADVRQFVVEYLGRDGTLPTKKVFDEGGEEIDAEVELLHVLESGNALDQIFEEDNGEYYFVDITKLGKIHLSDTERGYVINEGTLNVYVLNPLEYNGTNYYTLTPYLTGKEKIANFSEPFEISVMGNPVKWTNKAEILVTIPNVPVGKADGWTFRWKKGACTISDFQTATEVNYFTYGDTIIFMENGIYTVNVENPEGRNSVRKIIVTKIDDIAPTISLVNKKLVVDDAETGVKSIHYKIKETANFQIDNTARTQNPKYYTSAKEDINDTTEDALNKYLWEEKNIKGDKIDRYFSDYEEYYKQFQVYNKTLTNDDATSGEIANSKEAIRILNRNYPQFAYNNKSFPDSEKNIVIYVEDLSGNGAIYSAISREELMNFQYLSSSVETMTDSEVTINNGDLYTNDRDVSLYVQAAYAKYYFATEEENPTGTYNYFDRNKIKYTLTEDDGEKKVNVFLRDENGNTKIINSTILLDKTAPSKDAPTITGDTSRIYVELNQTDTKVVDGKETQSGLSDDFRIGIRESTETSFTWYDKARQIPQLIDGKTYIIVTRVADNAGNVSTSDEAEFGFSAIMISKNDSKGFWKSTYKGRITSIEFKKGNTAVPTGAIDLGNLATDTENLEIRAYLQDDGYGDYRCTVISPYLIYANVDSTSYFEGFSNLRTVKFENFDTSKVDNMYCMFCDCSSLTSLDVSGFDTNNVTNMKSMFKKCDNLKTIYARSTFNVTGVTESEGMFLESTKLVGGSGTVYNSGRVDKTYAHIDDGTSNPGYFTAR